MGNTHVKPHPRTRNRKQVHWKAADRPASPGKPYLVVDDELTPDLIVIRWTKPIRDGGSPITGYLVEHRRVNSPHWVRATPFLTPFPELSLSGLEPGWRYQFRISAENAVGLSDPSEISEPLTVTQQKFAITAPKFTEELKDTVSLENEKVEFIVHYLGQPIPKICWFKDGFEIFSSRRTRILTEQDRSILTIHQSALADEGEIKCTATNKAGHASTKARLTLEAPPSIRLPRQYEDGLLFEIGEVIRLKVSVVGRPTPLIFWTHNGESIQDNDRYEIEYVDRCSILKINEARRSDRGEYQLKAVNKIGEDVTSFLVTITDKPSPPGKARVVMTLGRSVTLSWKTPEDDGGCKIGNYIIEYYRLGWNVWLKAATSRQLTTILGDLIEGSEYKFRIKAESPYGVSEPSEESETIFIPDPKRGITSPQARSKSTPKDIIDEITAAPKAAKRKSKPRSQSTTKAEITYQPVYEGANDEIPQRPERTKIKSPPKTPDFSPHTPRKPVNLMTETIIDRASIARELAYGSPEIKLKKADTDLVIFDITSSSSDHSSSPVQKEISSPIRSSSPNNAVLPKKVEAIQKTLGQQDNRYLPRENSETLEGSSEFMLVLYPDAIEKDQQRRVSIPFLFDDDSIPPPISLSAPELGIEPPKFYNLRQSASSTELLHERAMIRLNEEAAATEEIEQIKKTMEIPKIQINSQDIASLEQRISARRKSWGNVTQKQAAWANRRLSLRNSKDLPDILENKLQKVPKSLKEKQQKTMSRQRSESQEKEEQEFEKIRNKMQSGSEKRSIEVVDEEKWLEEYEESLSEEETESSEEEAYNQGIQGKSYSDEDEDNTYHPGAMQSQKVIGDEPFEILTKRNKLPDPNFVPKPILKKCDEKPEIRLESKPEIKQSTIKTGKIRSHSPMPPLVRDPEEIARQRSMSLTYSAPPLSSLKNNIFPTEYQGRQRSFSLIPQMEAVTTEQNLTRVLPSTINIASPGHNISAVAQLTGLTAASIILSETILKTKDDEESKVVIDHYGDIVRTFSQKRKKSIPNIEPRRSSMQVSTNLNRETNDVRNTVKVGEQNQNSGSFSSRESIKSVGIEGKSLDEASSYKDLTKPSTNHKSNIIQENISSVTEASIPNSSESRERSPFRKSPTPQRGRSDRRFQKKSTKRSKTPSKSPTRLENWSDRSNRKTSPSPIKRNISTSTRKSPSPVPFAQRRPMLREIMTQTSVGLEFGSSSGDSRASSPTERARHEELMARAEIKVRGVMEYLTDLAMFAVACWLYLFENELFAIPVLLIMVYRQLTDQLKRRIPSWIKRRFNKVKTKKNQ